MNKFFILAILLGILLLSSSVSASEGDRGLVINSSNSTDGQFEVSVILNNSSETVIDIYSNDSDINTELTYSIGNPISKKGNHYVVSNMTNVKSLYLITIYMDEDDSKGWVEIRDGNGKLTNKDKFIVPPERTSGESSVDNNSTEISTDESERNGILDFIAMQIVKLIGWIAEFISNLAT